MKIKFLVVLFLFVSFNLSAQNDTISNSEKEFEIIENMAEPHELEKNEPIYIHVKQMPEFPGGLTELRKFIAYNVSYPLKAKKAGIQGTVYLRFQIKKDGYVGIVEIQKGVHKLLDDASIKVVKSLPQFRPGNQNGKRVSVWYSIPVSFRLN